MKINIYLDDLRDCPDDFKLAKTADEAIGLMKDNDVGIISLDHDLGLGSDGKILPTGYDFVKYFCEHGLQADQVYIHTDNPVGRNAMYDTLKAAQRRGFIDDHIEIYRYGIVPNIYTDK